MKVHVKVTLEELVDTHMRTMARSKYLRQLRLTSALISALLGGGCLFALIPDRFHVKLATGVSGAVASAVICFWLHPRIMKRRIRRLIRENLGDDEAFSEEVELSPDGVHVTQVSCNTMFPWKNIEQIIDNPEFIEFRERHGGIVVVRVRAFVSSDAQCEFVRIARDWKAQK